MHLKSLKITNFRKFGTDNNEVEFVASSSDELGLANSIANSTTLIVGKNNAGKTTVTKALEKLVKSDIKADDFNYRYLNTLLEQYKSNNFDLLPVIIFKIVTITNPSDLTVNLSPFISIGECSDDEDLIESEITIKYELKENEIFTNALRFDVLLKYPDEESSFIFSKFIELLNRTDFKANVYNSSDELVDKFKIQDLISIEVISANKNLEDPTLSKTFNEIIKSRYRLNQSSQSVDDLDTMINTINKNVTTHIKSHNTSVNEILHEVENEKHLGVQLSSDLNFDRLMQNLIKYQYTEQGLVIPEGQFGLGYANLMNIIGKIIKYIDTYPEEEKHSRLNLLCIEEPENYMHPQMQELFINRIDQALKLLLENSGKKINSQLIITTHSSHILNSKIHTSNSFDNINYITNVENYSCVVKLNDNAVMSNEPIPGRTDDEIAKQRLNDLKFLKKHIKFKVSDLFFSDAVIIVEGVTEETLLPYYLEKYPALDKFYISVFNIDGAHGKVYHQLIKLLKIPVLLITDIDIKRSDEENENENKEKENEKIYQQITDLTMRTTTNNTIKTFNDNNDQLSTITNYFTIENLYCIFQRLPIQSQYSTSFEEALILQNYKNTILNKALQQVKPKIYKGIVGKEKLRDLNNLICNSYKLQIKLSDSKSDFANTLLYEMITADETEVRPVLPQYIEDGLTWLQQKLSPSPADTTTAAITPLEEVAQ